MRRLPLPVMCLCLLQLRRRVTRKAARKKGQGDVTEMDSGFLLFAGALGI